MTQYQTKPSAKSSMTDIPEEDQKKFGMLPMITAPIAPGNADERDAAAVRLNAQIADNREKSEERDSRGALLPRRYLGSRQRFRSDLRPQERKELERQTGEKPFMFKSADQVAREAKAATQKAREAQEEIMARTKAEIDWNRGYWYSVMPFFRSLSKPEGNDSG